MSRFSTGFGFLTTLEGGRDTGWTNPGIRDRGSNGHSRPQGPNMQMSDQQPFLASVDMHLLIASDSLPCHELRMRLSLWSCLPPLPRHSPAIRARPPRRQVGCCSVTGWQFQCSIVHHAFIPASGRPSPTLSRWSQCCYCPTESSGSDSSRLPPAIGRICLSSGLLTCSSSINFHRGA